VSKRRKILRMPPSFRFAGEIRGLEVARGYDGFLRGDPEPVVIVAVYVVSGPHVQMAGRTLHRFRAKGPFPSVATTKEMRLADCTTHLASGAPRWLVLATALEVDGGVDVQRVFGAMERHATLSMWAADARELEAIGLAAVAAEAEWEAPRAIQLFSDSEAIGASCRSDKWIGAACWWVEGAELQVSHRYRAPFLSEDRGNDWTAIVDLFC